MASFGELVFKYEVEPTTCIHGLAIGSCLSALCLMKRTVLPIKGEKSWDSKLQQPSAGTYQFPALSTSLWKSQAYIPFSLQWGSPSPSPSPSPPKALPASDRANAVIGFRAWRIAKTGETLRLDSLAKAGGWKYGVTTAKCERDVFGTLLLGGDAGDPNAHEAPGDHCTCGLYVLNTLKDVRKWLSGLDEYGWNKHLAVGAVVGWGEVIQHGDEGWRAEFGKVIALLDTSTFRSQPRLDRIAQQIGVPILPRKGLQLYAKEYGEALPA